MSILQIFTSRLVSRSKDLPSDMCFVNTMLQQKGAAPSHILGLPGKYVARLLRSLLWLLPAPSTSKRLLQIKFSPWSWASSSDVISDAVHYVYGTERSMTGAASCRDVVSVLQKAGLYLFVQNSFGYGVPKAVYDKEIRQVHTMIIPPPYHTCLGAIDPTEDTSRVDLSAFLVRLPCKAVPIVERTDPAVLISKMFPVSMTAPAGRYVAACFWSWLCVIDGKLFLLPCWLSHLATCTVVAIVDLRQT